MLNENFDKTNLIRVRIKKPATSVKEMLTRLGIGNVNEKILHQSCHLIKIEKDWFLVHFKEVYGMIGCEIKWDEGDIQRRNKIARMLEEWGYLDIINDQEIEYSYNQFNSEDNDIWIYRIKLSDKKNYTLLQKVDIKRFERTLLKLQEENNGNC